MDQANEHALPLQASPHRDVNQVLCKVAAMELGLIQPREFADYAFGTHDVGSGSLGTGCMIIGVRDAGGLKFLSCSNTIRRCRP
jgi:hypothetical protein